MAGDYMTDFLLHGLRALYGGNTVVDFPRRDGLYKTTAEFNKSDYLLRRAQLYGGGFSWGLKIDDFPDQQQLNKAPGDYIPSRDPANIKRLFKF